MKISDLDTPSISSEAKRWLANAIAGMICADGHVDDSEIAYLREVLGFLESVDEVNKVVALVKKKEKPILQVLKLDRQQSFEILKLLTSLAATDNRLAKSEAKFLKYAGAKLGFEPGFSNNMMKWAIRRMEADKMEKELWEMANKSVPDFTDRFTHDL